MDNSGRPPTPSGHRSTPLGLVAAHALGLTPLVFMFARGLFVLTAKTYAEGAAMFPKAGGSWGVDFPVVVSGVSTKTHLVRKAFLVFAGSSKPLLAVGLLICALLFASCGESAQEKAKAQVCGARSDISRQVKTLTELT